MRCWTFIVCAVVLLSGWERSLAAEEGALPTDDSGRALNFDFEDGTLRDWTASGAAFEGQPVQGDTVNHRRGDMKSRHQGKFWVGTYEVNGDQPTGTLTSATFTVTKPWGTFLIGGGGDVETERLELVRAEDGKVFYRATGRNAEDMRRVAVDLHKEVGKKIFIRLVDDSSGGWGHINFDDFRLHDSKPLASAEASAEVLTNDVVKNAGLSPEEAIKEMTLPPGFKAQLVAGEPDVVQPVALAIDDRGRLWVAEALNYPQKAPPGKGRDKILIFEDEGNGHWKRTVFMDGLNLVSGLEIGFGGVWIGQAPELLYVPILEGDKPGKPEVLLDGWAYQDTHETLNSFAWGPDGWLYGCQGVFNQSLVGKPGTPKDRRQPLNACVWRYHPAKKVFEIYAEGGSNQWGIDWNEQGQMFMTCCVIPHLYQVIQGGRYVRQAGPHLDPYTFDDIKTIADHLHWATSAANQWAANNKSDAFGGGHAHAGAMIYLGDNWPAEYRNQIFMGNIHGNRMNEDLLEAKGSGYVAHHGKDFLLMNDKWSRLISEKYGPDGGVYVIDWYDKQACHLPNSEVWDRSNGRIYKITYGEVKGVKVDLGSMQNVDLAKLLASENEWYVRHARRILQERLALQRSSPCAPADDSLGDDVEGVIAAAEKGDERRRLRAMWFAYAAGVPDEKRLQNWLADQSATVRAAAIHLTAETRPLSGSLLSKLEQMANEEQSAAVRLALASAMRHLLVENRWGVVTGLLKHGEDANDQNLPLMEWYDSEPLVISDPLRCAKLAIDSKIPLVRQFIARRLAMMSDRPKAIEAAVSIIEKGETEDVGHDALVGILEGFAGKRSVKMPPNWEAAQAKLQSGSKSEIQQAFALAVIFGDSRALQFFREAVQRKNLDLGQRQLALESLLAAKDPQLAPVLQKLVDDPKLRDQAVRGLAGYDDPKTPAVLIHAYGQFDAGTKLAALNALASRAAWAKKLLAAIDAGKIAKADLTSPTVRNLSGLEDKTVSEWIAKNWGSVKASDAEKKAQIAKYRRLVGGNTLVRADAENGRAVFARTCMQCHTLFGVGAKIGPDLTGSNRANAEYLIENIVDPSAVIGKDYLLTTIRTKDGEQLDGIVKSETADTISIATVNELRTMPKSEIAKRKTSDVSMMPEGLLMSMSEREIKDLIKYLASPAQTAMLANPQNVTNFFDGKSLAWWTSDHMELWHVENGEIVGKTEKGIKHNNFLFSELALENFRLVVRMKLVPNEANSGIQFRSVPWENGEAKGYQADMGHGWWGKIYEESARGLLTKVDGEQYLHPNEWNTYEILAVGSHIRTAINGHVCSEINDPDGAKRGQTALQIHAGGPTDVRFKDFKLELNPKDEMVTQPKN